jgi:hypothetical protein
MPEHDNQDDLQLEDRLRRAFRWMAEEAPSSALPSGGVPGARPSRNASNDHGRTGDAGLYLDDPVPGPAPSRAHRKPVLIAAVVIVLMVAGVAIGLVATSSDNHGPGGEKTATGPNSTAQAQVVSALAATTSAGNWDISYTYGESQGSTLPTTPSTIVNCSPSLEAACPGSSGGLTSPQNVTVTGTGIINVNPKAMVTIANVSDFGRVVLRLNASDVWELLSGDSGGLAPDSGDAQTTGQSLAGYAGLVESTLGTREGAVAMLGIASPTGYLELDEQAIANVTPNGTATVNGQTVTKYTVAVQPSELASDPTASPDEVSAIQAALSTLATSGMSGTTDQVAVDGQGFIIQSISTYEFSDGGSVTVQADFSNFGCAGTVLMPGQTGAATPPAGCVSPDTPGSGGSPSTASTTTSPTTPTTSPSNGIQPGGPMVTTIPPLQGPSSTTSTSTTTTSTPTSTPITVVVPNVIGLSPAQASAALEEAGLTVQFTGSQNGATVTSQSPSANSRAAGRSVVVLTTQ